MMTPMKLKTASKDLSPAATAAADWWAEAIGSPRFNHVTNDERSDMTDLTQMMASIVAAQYEPDEGAGIKFVAELAGTIDKQLESSDGRWSVTLGVDYGPDRELGEAAEKAGIHGSRFPWKTNMWVKRDHVTVSAGYRGATQLVWASEEWLANRPFCNSRKWDESIPYDRDYHGEPWACLQPMYHDGGCVYDRPLGVES